MTDLRPPLIVEADELTRAFLLDSLAADGFRVAGGASDADRVRSFARGPTTISARRVPARTASGTTS